MMFTFYPILRSTQNWDLIELPDTNLAFKGIKPITSPLRLFIALELPISLQHRLAEQITALRQLIPTRDVTWVKPAGLHLTLKFLGAVPAQQLSQINMGLQQAVIGHSAFELQLTGMGVFPSGQKPKVIWVGLQGQTDALQQLRDAVERELSPLGYPTEARPFHPHLTLGRVKTLVGKAQAAIGQQVKQVAITDYGGWQCHQVSVMESTLKPSGAEYTALHIVDLT